MKNKLLLFDIDGTILSTHGIPRIAMGNVLSRRYQNFHYDENFNFSGRTDWEIIEHLLDFAGQTSSPDLVKKIMQEFAVELEYELQNGKPPFVYTGVRQLLDSLANLPGIYLGLVTGNIEAGAKLKLSLANLWHHFDVGGFGNDARNRSDLPPLAISRAKSLYGAEFSEDDTWIIGDSEFDIKCACDNNLHSLAVSTGWTGHDVLAKNNPDYLVEDFSDVDAIQKILVE